MDATFFQGMAAFVSAVLVFCGSVFLLLAMVLGARLSYFITASVTLGFLVIMGVVWSINPLGPVGQLPEWKPVDIGESADELEFGPASSYPDSPWRAPDEEDDVERAKASELDTSAADYLETAIDDEEVTAFDDASDASPADDLTLLTESGGEEYGMVTLEALEGEEGGPVVVVMSYDPGDPLGEARLITGGTTVLFGLHLFGLSRAEKKSRRKSAANEGAS
jgi:hypothetical protein